MLFPTANTNNQIVPYSHNKLPLHAIAHTSPRLGLILRMSLRLLLHLRHARVARVVRLDGLLAVRRELRLPVALAGFLLVEGVLLVTVVVFVGFCVMFLVWVMMWHLLRGRTAG